MNKDKSKYKNLEIGKLKIEKNLINNDEFRKVTIRNRSGKVILIKNYKNNKLSGEVESFWPNGNVHVKGQYVEGVRSGTFKTYSDKGEVLLEEKYSKL